MWDSIDMVAAGFGEKLLPALKTATKWFGHMAEDMGLLKSAEEEQIEALQNQNMHLRILKGTLNDAEVGSDLYNTTLNNIKTTYPDVLSQFDTHKMSLEDINTAIENSIDLSDKRIEQLKVEMQKTNILESQKELQKELYDAQLKTAQGFAQHEQSMEDVYNQLLNNIAGSEDSMENMNALSNAMDGVRNATEQYKKDGDLEAYYASTKKATEDFKSAIGELATDSIGLGDQLSALAGPAGIISKQFVDLAVSGDGLLDIGLNFLEIDGAMSGLTDNYEKLIDATNDYNSASQFFQGNLKHINAELDKLEQELQDLEDQNADAALIPGGDTEASAEQIAEIEEQIAQHELYKKGVRDAQLAEEEAHWVKLLDLDETYYNNTIELQNQLERHQIQFDQKMLDRVIRTYNTRNAVSFAQIDAQNTYAAAQRSYELSQFDLHGQELNNKLLEQHKKRTDLDLEFAMADREALKSSYMQKGHITQEEQDILDNMDQEMKNAWKQGQVDYYKLAEDLEDDHQKNIKVLKNLHNKESIAIDKRAFSQKLSLAIDSANELVTSFSSNAEALFGMNKEQKKQMIQVEKGMAIALGVKEIVGIWSTAPFGPETYLVKGAQTVSAALRTAGNVAKMDQALASIDSVSSDVSSKAKTYSFSGEVAAVGFSGMIDKPTNLLVGEAGSEMVNVTPLDGRDSVGGENVTVNVSGNVMTQEFVEGELADAIQEAVRRGTTFGA